MRPLFATLRSTQANKGKLMTGGLWSLTMHANYFGDTLLFTGWTLASSGLAVSWTWWAVPVMTALFVFMHIPVRAQRPHWTTSRRWRAMEQSP